jgi:hypothetical protein
MAKSETRTIDVQHALETWVCRRTHSCETDFAISIIFGVQGRCGMMAPREPKRAISKILVNQRRNEPPCCHRLAHDLAFTKSAQEP